MFRCGKERFRGTGIEQELRLRDYWQWSGSMLLDNTQRGILAEFLVTAALDLHNSPRREWDAVDVRLPSKITIEVKSAAYIQSWEQSKYSTIRFGIAPRHYKWNSVTGENEYSKTPKRWAQIYVFCIFKKKQARFDPLDMDAWDFYVIATSVLDQKVPVQKTIGLRSLEQLSAHKCNYEDLKNVILEMEKEIKNGAVSSA